MKSVPVMIVVFLAFTSFGFALDNPDAPDYAGEFEKRIAPLEKHIQEAVTTLDYIERFGTLEEALDKEMNVAYKLLMSKLGSKEKKLLKASQIQWLKFRDAEFKWIETNWVRDTFGSSYAISVGGYKTRIIKERVLHLLWYLKNY